MVLLCKKKVVVIAVLGVLFLGTVWSKGAAMPEFGKSIQFDKSGPDVTISQLQGKAVLVIFFQSWCGICNRWAPELIKQVQEAHGDNRSLVMIAIKTDGGGVAGAKSYLKSKGADLTKWCIGSDKNAAFYKKVSGGNELWKYTLVGGDGNIVKQGSAGSYWGGGPNKTKYVLASSGLLKRCGKLETVLPADKEYASELSHITRCAELGSLGKALSLCSSAKQRSKTRVAAKELEQDILSIIDTRMKSRMEILKDAEKSGGSRYVSYKELSVMVKDLRTVPIAKEANVLLSQARRDPVIQKEIHAETAYIRVKTKLKKASKRDRPRILRELTMIAKKYEGTKYGELAAVESQGKIN